MHLAHLRKEIVILCVLSMVMGQLLLYLPVHASISFTDISASHPNYAAIMELKRLGIVEGYPDGSFRPRLEVNRAAGLKMSLVGSKNNVPFLIRPVQNFLDVDPRAWYSRFVHRGYELGIVQGFPDLTFRATRKLTLAEALKMLLVSQGIAPESSGRVERPYDDVLPAQWYYKYLYYAKEKNLVEADSQNRAYPLRPMTRAQLAEILYRILFIQKNHLEAYPVNTALASFTPVVSEPVNVVESDVDPNLNKPRVIYGGGGGGGGASSVAQSTPPPAPPSVQFTSASSSGEESIPSASLTVALSQASSQQVTVNYVVSGGNATGDGSDYTLSNGSLAFAPGEMFKNIHLSVVDDATHEPGETVMISLNNPVNVTLGSLATHTYTITDNDAPGGGNVPSIAFASASATGNENVTPVSMIVTLSQPSTQQVSVNYSVSGGTATGNGSDYTLTSGTLTFTPGETSKNLSMTVVDDFMDEPDENVVITISSPVGAFLGGLLMHTYTILDNDATASSDVQFTIDPTAQRHDISPYIYGTNDIPWEKAEDYASNMKLMRYGGNRWTGYNWENNASNAGTDWGPNSSDDYLSSSDTPGEAVKIRVEATSNIGADTLLTIPIVDYVAADKNGVVTEPASDTNLRFMKNFPVTPGNLLPANPDVTDNAVYQDQFVNWAKENLSPDHRVFYSLDNEPGIWPYTHPMIHPLKTTYAEMAERTTNFSRMIKQYAPDSLVFGAIAYGYFEYVTLQGAPDRNDRDYLDFFLDTAKQAEATYGKRLVDVLDLHWYPEAMAAGNKVIDFKGTNDPVGVAEGRLQSPRSLWDPTYKEDSWITNEVLNSPIRLIPWLKEKIAQHYPGTKLAFTEYNYGGGENVTGAITQADVLGIFGREGVFAATLWPFGSSQDSRYVLGAFDLFINYDGTGASVGDVSVSAQNSDIEKTSVYAFAKISDPNEMYVMALNKTTASLSTAIHLTNTTSQLSSAQVYQLVEGNPKPKPVGTVAVTDNQLTYQMPARSVTLFVFK